jgi:rhodanese-related sulfurtransferase
MKSTKSRKPLLSLLFVLMALVMAVAAVAPAASARSVNADKADKKVFTAVDTFLKALPNKGGEGYWGTISVPALVTELASTNKPLVVDVRPPSYFAAGHIPGAVNIPAPDLLDNLDKLGANDRPIVVYCVSGLAAAVSMESLTLVGYTNVRTLGGFSNWTNAGQPTEN